MKKDFMLLSFLNLNLGLVKITSGWDFHGGPVVETPLFHCGGHEFHPWLGN